jgi:hypothetical protein
VQILVRRDTLISYYNGTEILSALQAAKHFPEIARWILVERFIDQLKIESFTSGVAAHASANLVSDIPRTYDPAAITKVVSWNTMQLTRCDEIDDFVQQKIKDMQLGPFVARQDRYIEQLAERC